MNSKIAFCIPIHEPNFRFLSFLNSLSFKDSFTIAFILTFKHEKAEIANYIDKHIKTSFKNIEYLSLEDGSSIEAVRKFNSKEKGLINIKKYYGLNSLAQTGKYDYLACVDSEIKFVETKNVYNRLKLQAEKKAFICGDVTNANTNLKNCVYFIYEASTSVFNKEDREKLKLLTNNGDYYFWFSDIPLYKTDLLKKFLKFLGFESFDDFCGKMSFYTFDYVVYAYYCLLYHDHKLLCTKDYGVDRSWSMDSCPHSVYEKVKEKMGYRANWVIEDCYKDNINLFKNDPPILLYHCNREEMSSYAKEEFNKIYSNFK